MVRWQTKQGPSRCFSNQPCRFAFADQRLGRLLLLGSVGGMMFYGFNWNNVINGTGDEQDCFFLAGIRAAV